MLDTCFAAEAGGQRPADDLPSKQGNYGSWLLVLGPCMPEHVILEGFVRAFIPQNLFGQLLVVGCQSTGLVELKVPVRGVRAP